MQLLVLILKKVECMDELLKQLAAHDIKGGTIVDAHGMGEALIHMEDMPMFGSLRHLLSSENKEQVQLLLMVIREDQVKPTTQVIQEVIGDLKQPNTGILFTLPISYCEGLVESNE